jgi:hypothetical protein
MLQTLPSSLIRLFTAMLFGSRHHCKACHRVEDRGDGLQVWRVAANAMNELSRTADKGWSPACGLDEGLVTSHRKKISLLRNVTHGLRRALVDTAMNLQVLQKAANILTTC